MAVGDVRRRLLVHERRHLWILLGIRERVLVHAAVLLGDSREANNRHLVVGVLHCHKTEIAVPAHFQERIQRDSLEEAEGQIKGVSDSIVRSSMFYRLHPKQ